MKRRLAMHSRFLSSARFFGLLAGLLFLGAFSPANAAATNVHLIEIGRQVHNGIVTRTFAVRGVPLAVGSRAELLILPRVILARLCRGPESAANCVDTGTSIPFARRPEPYADPTFELFPSDQNPAPRTLTVWTRLDMPFAYVVESRNQYVNRLLLARTIDAAFLGALVAVLFFSVVALVELRTSSSLFFIGYVCSLFVVEFVATGIGMQYIWPQFAFDRTFLVLVASELGFVMYFLFARSFVSLDRRFPLLNNIAIIALALQVTLATIEYVFPSTTFRGVVVGAEFFTLAVLGFSAVALVGTPGVSRLYAISFFPPCSEPARASGMRHSGWGADRCLPGKASNLVRRFNVLLFRYRCWIVCVPCEKNGKRWLRNLP
ncbi:MAG: 7TM-DISM domain-containing protein [Vulcanimicrobiaceae bacterium]